ncbi:hypothetical protein F4774DRAFT_157247 [Daldinia eschscholtzii]|nr:hypothetical protein F4774DRAFT_157247 [Daldinia eschscholtzii]
MCIISPAYATYVVRSRRTAYPELILPPTTFRPTFPQILSYTRAAVLFFFPSSLTGRRATYMDARLLQGWDTTICGISNQDGKKKAMGPREGVASRSLNQYFSFPGKLSPNFVLTLFLFSFAIPALFLSFSELVPSCCVRCLERRKITPPPLLLLHPKIRVCSKQASWVREGEGDDERSFFVAALMLDMFSFGYVMVLSLDIHGTKSLN